MHVGRHADMHTACMHAQTGHKASFLATPHELDETGLESESYTRLHLKSRRTGVWGMCHDG